MTRCSQTSRLISSVFDDRIDLSDKDALEQHLRTCAPCARQWERMHTLHCLLLEAPALTAPSSLRSRVLARINTRSLVARRVFGGVALALGLGTLSLLALPSVAVEVIGMVETTQVLRNYGPASLDEIRVLISASARVLAVLASHFALPAVCVALVGFVFTVLLGGAWVGTVRRLALSR
jgi:anti-sigma factor RsiW